MTCALLASPSIRSGVIGGRVMKKRGWAFLFRVQEAGSSTAARSDDSLGKRSELNGFQRGTDRQVALCRFQQPGRLR